MGIMTVIGMSSIVAGPQRVDGDADRGPRLVGRSSSAPANPGEHLSDEERRRRKGITLREVKAIHERCRAGRGDRAHGAAVRQHHQVRQRERARRPDLRHHRGLRDGPRHLHGAGPLPLGPRRRRAARGWRCIGADIADTLFPYVDPLDKEVQIDGRRFRVIGVMERKGKFLWMNRDNFIAVPLGSVQKKDERFDFIVADVKPVSPARIETRGRAGARGPAPRAQAALLAEGQLRRLHPGHAHRPVPPDHRRHLHGDDRDLVHRPAGGRRGRDEHHAGLGDRADARDRRAQGARRQAARHPAGSS